MEEISTSFCFICLLHLANEQGLKLESAVKEEDEVVPEEVIEQQAGDIWDIKVRSPLVTSSFLKTHLTSSRLQIFRDPTATPAA